MGAKMTYKADVFGDGEIVFTFEKFPGGGTVNIYNSDGVEVDVFTNYDIEGDFDAFEEACLEWVEDFKEELGN